MKKNLSCLILILNVFLSDAQNSSENLFFLRKEFTVKNDTTIIENEKLKTNLDFLCSKNYSNKKIFLNYDYSVFGFSKNKYFIKQWNTPLIIFFDKKIPNIIVDELKKFTHQLRNINNLSISYTKNIEKANYYIQLTDDYVSGYGKKHKFSEEEKLNHPFYNLSYKILTDKNNKLYACKLKINNNQLKDFNLTIKKLKQVFYLSLGNFILTRYNNKSLISKKYINEKLVSNDDIDFLKIHYGIIYPQKINGYIFKKLIENTKKKKCTKQ